MSSFARITARRRSVISLTPLIDVVFILLVFFMLASSFMDWRYVTMDTPSMRAASLPEQATALTLVVGRTGVSVDGQNLSDDELLTRARRHLQQHPELAIRVQPAADTPLQRVMTILDTLSAAGLEPLTLVRDPAWQDIREAD